MVNVNDIIQDPSVNILGQRAAISDNPFTAGQRFVANNSRERQLQQLMQSIGGNNQLRQLMQQRIMQGDFQTEALKNQEQLRLSGGAPLALGAAGFEPNPFSRNQAKIAQEGQRADVQATISGAGLDAAKSGQAFRQSPESQGITGMQVHSAIPLSVQEQQASGLNATITDFLPKSGQKVVRDATASDIIKGGGELPEGTGPQLTEAQQIKFQDISNKLENNGNNYTANVRADGIMEIIEEQPGGAKEVVLRYDLEGRQVNE